MPSKAHQRRCATRGRDTVPEGLPERCALLTFGQHDRSHRIPEDWTRDPADSISFLKLASPRLATARLIRFSPARSPLTEAAPMRVTVVQMNPGANKADNIAQAARLIGSAVDEDKPDIVSLPEV